MATDDKPPTARQLRYLRELAVERGETYAVPKTSAQASREIERLLSRPRSSRAAMQADRRAVSRDLQERQGGADYRRDEVQGYGSSAAWRYRS